jgi:hypothetical protein
LPKLLFELPGIERRIAKCPKKVPEIGWIGQPEYAYKTDQQYYSQEIEGFVFEFMQLYPDINPGFLT